MTGSSFSTLDWMVIGLYFTTLLVIGIISLSKVKDTDGFFLGGRRFGRLVMIGQSFGSGTHAEMPVSLAGIVYSVGLSGIWFQWKNLFVTPLYWLMAPLYRRFRRTTMSEVIEDRYGPWMGGIYTAFAIAFLMLSAGGMLKGAGKVIVQATGMDVSTDMIVVIMACGLIVFGLLGGLFATAWSDVLQGLLIITLSFIVIPVGWKLAGGLAGIRDTIGANRLSLVVPEGIGLWFILVLTLNGLFGIVAQPQMIATVGTGKDEFTGRVGQFYGNMIKRVCTIGWALVGLLVATLVAKGTFGVTALRDPEEAFGFACRNLLFPGGVGLLVACIFASNMATCSTKMVTVGALVTNALYRRYLCKDGSERHYLFVGRVSGLMLTLMAALYAIFLVNRVLHVFLLTESLAAFVGITLLGGIVWRRANRWGALACIVVSMGGNFGALVLSHQRFDHWSPNIFAAAMLSGMVSFVAVSLLTPPERGPSVERFYENINTPSSGDVSAPASKQPAAAGQQLILVNLLNLKRGAKGLPFVKAYRIDLIGLAVGCVMILALIALVWALLARG